jgi:hypothetical protein
MWRTRASVAALLLAAAPTGCGGGSDTAEDAAANDAILSELPTYPHAQVYDKTVNPYYEEDGRGPVLGHTTNVNYEVPEGTEPRAVVRFYLSRIEPEWRCRTERDVPIRILSGRRLPRQTYGSFTAGGARRSWRLTRTTYARCHRDTSSSLITTTERSSEVTCGPSPASVREAAGRREPSSAIEMDERQEHEQRVSKRPLTSAIAIADYVGPD